MADHFFPRKEWKNGGFKTITSKYNQDLIQFACFKPKNQQTSHLLEIIKINFFKLNFRKKTQFLKLNKR